MTSEAKIYSLLSKEVEDQQVRSLDLSQKHFYVHHSLGRTSLLPPLVGRDSGLVPGRFVSSSGSEYPGERTQEPRACQGAIKCLCRLLCQPCLGQSCSHPLREGTVRLTWERGDEGNL